jgi:hypothetical protein
MRDAGGAPRRAVPRLRSVSLRPSLYDYSSSKYSPGTSSSGTSRVRTSLSSRSPASSTPATTPASNALPSSINSSTLSESALSTLDKPCRSPDCPADPAVSRANAEESRLLRVLLLSALSVFPLIVFFRLSFFVTVLLGAAVFLTDFLGTLFFFGCFFICFAGVAFRPTLFFDFLLLFFLLTIGAV